MKIKSLLTIIMIAVFSSIAFAQSVVITPKKVTYKRPKPITDDKKSFTVTYPKVKGVSPALAGKIENTIAYQRIFSLNIKEEISEVQWLEEASYNVDYNKNGILGITLSIEGWGAYPSNSNKSIIVNLKTGAQVRPQDVFIRLAELAAKGRKAQQAEVKTAIVEIKKENPEEQNPADLFRETNFTVKDLNEFSVDDKGVTFLYNYEFPHVIQALQPDGGYFFSWQELKPFIKPGGLLAKFVR
jgi:hypothetical protein